MRLFQTPSWDCWLSAGILIFLWISRHCNTHEIFILNVLEYGFNPCFGGSRGWDKGQSLGEFRKEFGFNPCFGGSRGWDIEGPGVLLPDTGCFNPCFGGSRGWDPWIWTMITDLCLCFNPCFGGSRGWDHIFHQVPKMPTGVSILVLVDRGVGTLHRIHFQAGYRWFQSLFWWIEGLGHSETSNCHFSLLSFNPCFGGSRGWDLFP